MEVPPRTHYAQRGTLSIAYQVFGEGRRTVVGAVGLPSHLDLMWTDASYVRGLRRAGAFARFVMYDSPGLGLSDPVDHVPTIEEQADDLEAVMDHAGVQRATVFGATFSAAGAVLFCARSPQRVDGLLLWAPLPQSVRTTPPDRLVGWAGRKRIVEAAWLDAVKHWGEGRTLSFNAPGLEGERLRRAWGTLERASASPAMVRAITEAAQTTDMTTILPLIQAPTVVVQHADCPIPEAVALHVVDLIPNAEFRRLPPSAECGSLAGWHKPLIDEMERLVTGRAPGAADTSRGLVTVLFTDIVSSTELAASIGDQQWRALADRHEAILVDLVEAEAGRVVRVMGDGALCEFDGPARAIHCAHAICSAVRELGMQARAGVHTGECERVGNDLAGLAVHIGARVQSAARPGEVWVSRTVRDLVAGSGLQFTARGRHQLKGVPGEWELFSLTSAESAPIPADDEPLALRVADRVVLATARRAPRLLRALSRTG